MEDNYKKAIFIGGSIHSGTTMMSRLFSQHSKALKIGSESRVAESYYLLSKAYHKIKSNADKIHFLEENAFYGANFKRKKYQYQNKRKNLLEGNINESDLSHVFNLDYRKLINQSLSNNNLDFVVEKTPSNAFYAKEIEKLFPEFKMIIIHRDVRDVITSLKKRYLTLKKNPESYAENLDIKKLDKDYNLMIDALMWNKLVLKSYESLSKYGDDKIKIVKYEEFVEDPENITKQLCQWVGIDYEDHMLNLNNRNSAYKEQQKNKGINNSSVGSFNHILKPEEISVIEKYAGKGMDILNLKKNNCQVNRSAVLKHEVISFFKIFKRVRKRLVLMNPSYAFNFGKHFLKKFF